MDKTYIVPLILIVLLGGFVALNWQELDPKAVLEKECPKTSTDPSCIVRWRAQGHLLSSAGINESIDNLLKATYWYNISAEKGDEESMFHLGWTYWAIFYKLDDFEKPKSFKEVVKNMQEGNQDIVPKSEYLNKAKAWYKKSADKGFAPAMNNLAFFYNIPSNEEEREINIRLASKAANAGNPMGVAYYAYLHKNSFEFRTQPNQELGHEGRWDPNKVDPRDLLKPTLERTIWRGWEPDYNTCSKIREAAKEGAPIVIGW